MKAYALILGGGSASRMGGETNKVFMPIRGIPAIVRATAPFTGICAGAVIVARPEEVERMETVVRQFGLTRFVLKVTAGGDTRQASVFNGLQALPEDAEIVMIHDGARALVTEDVIGRALRSAAEHGSGVASVAVGDTIKRVDEAGGVRETLDRSQLRAMQTPQAFQVDLIRQAHAAAQEDGFTGTDDAALLEHAGLRVFVTEGSRRNIKLTTAFDLLLANAILEDENE
ncbi:MAG: 2-C-methyl-D-erythritol 4-phosphate cytidylyltransferase [Clostridiales bacterium]|nr:2-C-methyl-D-erythritol 4-phosphate cytidylyltransferase [Clostridiales bacterium]